MQAMSPDFRRASAGVSTTDIAPALAGVGPTLAGRVWAVQRRVFQHKEITAAIILLALGVLLALGNENFLSARSLTLEARSMSFVGMASLGAMLVLSMGQLDLSVGSCMGLAGVLAAYCTVHGGLPDATVLLVVLVTGALYGLINGALVVGLHLNSLIVTLATGLVGRGIVYALTNGLPVSGFSKGLRYFGAGFWLGLPVPVWILLGFTIVFSWIMSRTTFGWRIYAIGGNEEAVRLSGVPVDRIKVVAFVIAGIMAAIGGLLLTARLGSGEVNVGTGYELDIIAAAVIGGLRFGAGSSGVTPIGILLGVAVMSVLRSAISFLNVPTAYQPIVIGSAILLAMGLERLRSIRRA
jgi:ribose/xylose/arabinose/galactoside ABC-type transport system permease subunit